MTTWPLHYEEPLFRPPSEASSLIVQATVGCSWNRCTFCGMYRMKRYRVRDLEEVGDELRRVAPRVPDARRVFLADGDALSAPTEYLLCLLDLIREVLPQVQRVGLYGDSRAILRKGREELERLGERGLGIIYFGAESGDDQTLKAVRKGATAGRQLEACHATRAAGIKLSVMVLLGLAGVAGSERHARATGRFLAEAGPAYAAALTVTPVRGTELYEHVLSADFELPDRWGMLRELLWLLEEMDGYRGLFHANHASNYLPLKLRMPRDREGALELLRRVLSERDESHLRPEWARGL